MGRWTRTAARGGGGGGGGGTTWRYASYPSSSASLFRSPPPGNFATGTYSRRSSAVLGAVPECDAKGKIVALIDQLLPGQELLRCPVPAQLPAAVSLEPLAAAMVAVACSRVAPTLHSAPWRVALNLIPRRRKTMLELSLKRGRRVRPCSPGGGRRVGALAARGAPAGRAADHPVARGVGKRRGCRRACQILLATS